MPFIIKLPIHIFLDMNKTNMKDKDINNVKEYFMDPFSCILFLKVHSK